jgi:chromosome partitioning protein
MIIAIANQKGGVGKTTTAISLGAALADCRRRVLLVDLDAQANATSGLGRRLAPGQPTAYEALAGGRALAETIIDSGHRGLDLAPASSALAGAEVELVPALARELRLRQALAPIQDRYDYVLIDCPPSLGLLTVNALTAAHTVLIPVQCEYLSLEGLTNLMQILRLVRGSLNPPLHVIGVLLTMFDPRTNLAQQVADEVRRHYPQTFRTLIPRSVRLGEAPSYGRSILDYDPTSRGATAYRAVAEELVERTT